MKRLTKVEGATDAGVIKAKRILKAGKALLDELESTPKGFIESNDLEHLYYALIEDLPALDFAINADGIVYNDNLI